MRRHMARIKSQYNNQPNFATASPSQLFWWFAGCHLIIWTVIPTIICRNAPLDVIEGYVWGHEWLMGTYKHPPMQAWILETLALLTGRASWAHFFASQVAIIATFWAVWQTGRKITGEISALVAVMLLEGIAYYNFTSPEFNPNVLQLPFWALACWSFHRAVRDDNLADWLLCSGLWAGGRALQQIQHGWCYWSCSAPYSHYAPRRPQAFKRRRPLKGARWY